MNRPGISATRIYGIRRNGEYRKNRDIQPDFVLLDCPVDSLETVALSWKKQGVEVLYSFRINNGSFQDYLDGDFDRFFHWDEVQTDRNGNPILRGPKSPYMVPTLSFLEFLFSRLKRAVDCGIGEICLEDAEFRANSGYSPAFQTEWELFYGEPYQQAHLSRQSYHKTQKLKSRLMLRAVEFLAERLKAYARTTYNRNLTVWVALHSLVHCRRHNESCPLSEIAASPYINGILAMIEPADLQVSFFLGGKQKPHPFEAAWMEYAYFEQLAWGNGKKLMVLTDPEFGPDRNGGLPVLAATLLQAGGKSYLFRKAISQALLPLTVINCLPELTYTGITLQEGMEPVGLLLSDSALLQKTDTAPELSSESFAAFYGLCMPLLQQGLPVLPICADTPTALEHLLADLRILVVSYEFMKPASPSVHFQLCEWVRQGGTLIYAGDGTDPYHTFPSWWNTGMGHWPTPAAHLEEALGITPRMKTLRQKNRNSGEALFEVEEGLCAWLNLSPEQCIADEDAAAELCYMVTKAAKKAGIPLSPDGIFRRRKGAYQILHVSEDSKQHSTVRGKFLNLADPEYEIESFFVAGPGETLFLYDLSRKKDKTMEILAASARITQVSLSETGLSFTAFLPPEIEGICRIYAPFPAEIFAGDSLLPSQRDRSGKTLFFRFHTPNGSIRIQVRRKTD